MHLVMIYINFLHYRKIEPVNSMECGINPLVQYVYVSFWKSFSYDVRFWIAIPKEFLQIYLSGIF
jgi:hypothetical protein